MGLWMKRYRWGNHLSQAQAIDNWRLKKGLYGLKQSGRQWYRELNAKLETIGFNCTESDWSMYVWTAESGWSYIMTSVNDMLIALSSTTKSDVVVNSLASLFEITDNGTPSFHLGCSITHNREDHTIKIDQQTYVQLILVWEVGLKNCNPVHTLL